MPTWLYQPGVVGLNPAEGKNFILLFLSEDKALRTNYRICVMFDTI